MKRILAGLLVVSVLSSSAFAQEETTRRHSSGPRRQLATIVFAGLGGAILGLSTLSFYGRPQDQLSNIAIGFAVGIIAGTAYVTVRSATTRDYYDERNAPTSLNDRQFRILNEDLAQSEMAAEPKVIYSPLLAKVTPDHNAYGGAVSIRF